MKEMSIGALDVTYFKGDEFRGMLYASFKTAEAANTAIEIISKRKLVHKDTEVRCWADASVEERTVRGLLLGLRWQLGEWGFNKKAIKVDIESGTMKVEGKLGATARVEQDNIKVSWNDQTWGEWKELHDSAELKELIDAGTKRLKRSAEGKQGLGKGKGLGKSASA